MWGKRPNTSIDFRRLVEKRADEAERSRDFYVAKTMAALRGEDIDPADFRVDTKTVTKDLEDFREMEKSAAGCVYLQPSDTGLASLPPLVISGGRPLASMKFLADDKLKHFLKKAAVKYAQKVSGDKNGDRPRVGFMLTAIDDPNKVMDLQEVVEGPGSADISPISLNRSGHYLIFLSLFVKNH